MFLTADHEHMALALRLAQRGLYTATPNPRVGCVIVRDGKVVGEGWHERAGEAHAEVNALRMAGNLAQGATAYVTLEPCSHHGRTPPCADALIAAGIVRVVAAMQDPNPLVAGQGIEKLRAAGIATAAGLMEAEARELNIGFVSRMTRGRPWVRVKIAASIDGKTALNNGISQWITGPDARCDAHVWRARSCAMLTGIGTVREDNPRLTVRDIETTRQPLRIVVDSRLETPLSARILEGGNALIATASEDKARIAALGKLGVQVVVLPNAQGKVDLSALLTELGRRDINEVMVEAGPRLNGSLLREGCVDELLIYQAPVLLGDNARGMVNLPELTDLSGKCELTIIERRAIGPDLRLIARLKQA
ncbi:fused diaminohydroxyphosphoribosylaminopyrimidine deaminase;5-amino-6-(5-phosphoribosylamino) uracil reductase [Georgfuchsia toluolica]|uniref:Riboflavin biosynthesis protein RibD n=1 Tax=Georgfuchsia toluolica TaxID=424218 RepID=A0A916N1R8_9PROT|nr:bifunctional diaminohydroxyphosphoribosylaminopyrimidine deaminase/5-amino-6-(5-phosphoribosylamino)uracil reductase RibD [Georgfuchsia toluolica]CAG4885220.1 fused diaminohydroxyphosphoribosylaminopyrimidine deaminase;5-amino-6-(5-phosphoribosylamino) uracil reductase [Georgfuchsia toluolica]